MVRRFLLLCYCRRRRFARYLVLRTAAVHTLRVLCLRASRARTASPPVLARAGSFRACIAAHRACSFARARVRAPFHHSRAPHNATRLFAARVYTRSFCVAHRASMPLPFALRALRFAALFRVPLLCLFACAFLWFARMLRARFAVARVKPLAAALYAPRVLPRAAHRENWFAPRNMASRHLPIPKMKET